MLSWLVLLAVSAVLGFAAGKVLIFAAGWIERCLRGGPWL